MKIKFRVWDGKQMWYPEEEHTFEPMHLIGPRGSAWTPTREGLLELNDDPETEYGVVAMLSTGFKDMNDKEIYEGDLVQYDIKTGGVSGPEEITFHDGCFILGHDSEDYVYTWNDEIRVIGNIYENPELMEVDDLP